MAYNVQKVSPSALAATEECPRFRPDGEENDAAIDGTLFHETMEDLVTGHRPETWAEVVAAKSLSPDLRNLVVIASEAVKDLAFAPENVSSPKGFGVYPNHRLRMRGGKPRATPLRPGVYPECEVDRGQGRHGYIDLLVVTPEGLAFIIDYKTNRNAKDFSLQLAAYACDVNRLCPAHDSFVCQVIAPRLADEDQLRMELGPRELAGYRKRIAAIEERADRSANDDSVVGKPGSACQYCHWKGRCKYQATDAAAVVAYSPSTSRLVQRGFYKGETVSPETFYAPATPKQRGLRRALLKDLEAMAKVMKESDKDWASANPGKTVPGWKLAFVKGRSSIDKTRMPDIRRALMQKFGFSAEELADVSVVDTDLLKESLVAVNGYTKKAADDEVKRCLEPFSVVGAASLRWTQEKDPEADVDADFVDVKPKEAIGD